MLKVEGLKGEGWRSKMLKVGGLKVEKRKVECGSVIASTFNLQLFLT
jgi:hypothetical protein